MHAQPGLAKRTFFARADDLASRDWPSRLSRFLRARLRRWCAAGVLLADDPRVLQAWWRGWDRAHCLKLRRWADQGYRPAVVYDIGAHEGLWSEMCQEILQPARCLLFEPQREFGERAMGRKPRPGANWELWPVALGEQHEKHVLHVTRNAAASSLLAPLQESSNGMEALQPVTQAEVQVVPLDALAAAKNLPPPDFVKIDVQGFEGRVLAGGKQTLSRAQRLVVEVSLHALYEGQSLMPAVLQTLCDWGFELEDVHETLRQWPGRLWQVDLWLIRRP